MSRYTPRAIADHISIGLSAVCAVHCLVLPVVVGMVPVFSNLSLGHGHFHQLLLALVLPLSVVALGAGWLRHRDRRVLILGLAGLILMTAAATIAHDLLGHDGERWLTLAGAALLALGHFRNYRRCKPSDGCHQGTC